MHFPPKRNKTRAKLPAQKITSNNENSTDKHKGAKGQPVGTVMWNVWQEWLQTPPLKQPQCTPLLLHKPTRKFTKYSISLLKKKKKTANFKKNQC